VTAKYTFEHLQASSGSDFVMRRDFALKPRQGLLEEHQERTLVPRWIDHLHLCLIWRGVIHQVGPVEQKARPATTLPFSNCITRHGIVREPARLLQRARRRALCGRRASAQTGDDLFRVRHAPPVAVMRANPTGSGCWGCWDCWGRSGCWVADRQARSAPRRPPLPEYWAVGTAQNWRASLG
jgi:hypothetical protein